MNNRAELGGLVPPEAPFTVRDRARINIGGAEAPNGDLAAMCTLVVPPLVVGGAAYIHALVKSDFWKALGPAILENRVTIVTKDAELAAESAVSHLNNALQILSHVADVVAAVDAVDIEINPSGPGLFAIPKLSADVRAVGRRVHHAIEQLKRVAPVEPTPPRTDDPRQLKLVDYDGRA